MRVHPKTGRAEASGPLACALCGEPFAGSARARALGVPPVVLRVCADIDGCTRRYLACPARSRGTVSSKADRCEVAAPSKLQRPSGNRVKTDDALHLARLLRIGEVTIVTSHTGVASWGERLGDPMLAASLLDRLLHRGVVVATNGTQTVLA